MIDRIETYAAKRAYNAKHRWKACYQTVAGLSGVQWLIILGLLMVVVSVLFANYVALVEGADNVRVWHLPGIAATVLFFLAEGIGIVFVAGWISNNLRSRRR